MEPRFQNQRGGLADFAQRDGRTSRRQQANAAGERRRLVLGGNAPDLPGLDAAIWGGPGAQNPGANATSFKAKARPFRLATLVVARSTADFYGTVAVTVTPIKATAKGAIWPCAI